jgi:hypothetical protein
MNPHYAEAKLLSKKVALCTRMSEGYGRLDL